MSALRLLTGFLILVGMWMIIVLAAWGVWHTASALAATPRAGGGRVPACRTVGACHKAIAWQRKHATDLERSLHHRTAADLHHAIAISSRLFGVPESAMTCIAWHESGYGRQTSPEPTSGALGPFQWLASSWATTPLGRAGYSRLDPLAASLSTAQRVVQDGGWREWVTGPGCGL